MMKLISIFILFAPLNLSSQRNSSLGPEDRNRKFIPYSPIREADVMWSKKTWRTIDLREKINHPLYFPTDRIGDRKSLIQTIRDATFSEAVIAYSSLDDEFRIPMSLTELKAIGTRLDTITLENPETGEFYSQEIKEEFKCSSVKKIRLKEEYFFDKQKSTIEVRIIGICPIREVLDENGEYRGDSPMFWIYFPEVRQTFANTEVFNRQNNAERLSLDDIFWKRWFSSHIYKESNVYDRQISEYKTGLDALLEGKRISEEIRDFEQDFWEY